MNRWLLFALFIFILLLPHGLRYLIQTPPFVEVVQQSGSLTDMEKKQLDIYLESIRLFITLATLLYGGLGFFIGASKERRASMSRRERLLIYASMVFAGITIMLGQVSYETLIWMLSTRFFNLSTPILLWSQTLQFWSLMLAVAFFGVFVARAVEGTG